MTTDEQQAELDRLAAIIERLDHTARLVTEIRREEELQAEADQA
jgi:hypothetical protein